MKFSIIVPVYNTEKYIRKCLNSIKNQTYSNYEVIIVNDGSPDNSQSIIDEFVSSDKRFHSYIKENGGLSDARNYGIEQVTGDYILFVDSDDYIDLNLLNKLSKIDSSYDMIKFKIKLVDEQNNLIKEEKSLCVSGQVSLESLFEIEFVEPAWTYIYKTSFFKKNKFKYEKGRIHEDFGLTPLCLIKAKKIYYLDYYGYYYVQRNESIIHSTNYKKRIEDMLFHFDNLNNKIDNEKNIDENKIKLFKNFLATRIIYTSNIIPIKEQRKYIKELKYRNVTEFLLQDTLVKKIKKTLFQHFPKIYTNLLTIKSLCYKMLIEHKKYKIKQ